jgi:hypothetical protein
MKSKFCAAHAWRAAAVFRDGHSVVVFFEYTDGDDLIDVVIFGQQHVEVFISGDAGFELLDFVAAIAMAASRDCVDRNGGECGKGFSVGSN